MADREKYLGVGEYRAFDLNTDYVTAGFSTGVLLGEQEGGASLKVSGTYEEIRTDASKYPDTVVVTQGNAMIEAVVKNVSKAVLDIAMAGRMEWDAVNNRYTIDGETPMTDLGENAKMVVYRPFGATDENDDVIFPKAVFQCDVDMQSDKTTYSGVELTVQALRNDTTIDTGKIAIFNKKNFA